MKRNLKLLGIMLASSMLLTGLAGCELPGAAGGNSQNGNQQNGDQQNQTDKNVHEGTISKDETWKKADGPHLIKGAVYVEAEQGVTLTIEPGTEVRFEQDASLNIGYSTGTRGVLLAQGTAEQPIVFTSAASSPQKGDWGTIYLNNGSASSVLTYCTIQYGGGGGSEEAAVTVYGANNKPTLSNCTIDNSAAYGVRMHADASFKVFENNKVKNSDNHPIRIGANEVGSLGSGNAFQGNAKPAIYVEGEDVSKSATWQNYGIPYHMQNSTKVQNESTLPVLTLKPGVTLEFAHDAWLAVGYNYQGALYAVGTAENKIVFTGVGQDAGSWNGIEFWDGTKAGKEGDANTTVVQHAIIEYAQTDENAMVYLHNAKPIIQNTTFRNGVELSHAVKVRGEAAQVPTHNNLFVGNTFAGFGAGLVGAWEATNPE